MNPRSNLCPKTWDTYFKTQNTCPKTWDTYFVTWNEDFT